MRTPLVLSVLLVCMSHFLPVRAASFDCSKAATWIEVTICDHEELSLQDDLLAKTYREVLSLPENAAEQKARQRHWLSSVRNNCTDASCLSTVYSERIRELREIALPQNEHRSCSGDLKRVLDLASAVDGQIPETARSTKYGQLNDGSLNYGGYWLRTDISLVYARSRCWQSARELIGKIGQDGLQEGANASLSIEYAKAGHFGPAIDVLDSLKSEEAFSASAYGIAEALVSAGRVEQAREVIMRVTTRWRHLESPSYWLINALVKAGRVNDAEKMIKGVDHTWNEYLLLADAYMKAGKKRNAESHIQKAISMAGNDPDAVAHIKGWTAYIYIEAKEFEKAYKAASEIPRPLGKVQAYLRLAEGLHRASRDQNADKVYAKAVATAEAIAGSEIGSACTFISESYGRTGNVKMVLSTVATMCPNKPTKSVALGRAINELAKLGDLDGSQTLQSMLDWRNDADGPIAAALARKGSYEQAAEMARGISNEFIRSDTVRRMASLKPPPKVVALWLEDTKTFKRDENRAASVQVLTAALARSKNSADAIAWLEPQPPDLAKGRGYLGIAQGMLGIVPGKGSPGD